MGGGILLGRNNLTGWNFVGKDLTRASFWLGTLTDTNFSQANLSDSYFGSASLTNTNFSQANLQSRISTKRIWPALIWPEWMWREADFSSTTGLTAAQLYSTASYQANELTGIWFYQVNASGWNLSGKDLTGSFFGNGNHTNANLSALNLTNVKFSSATLTNTNFTNATIRKASFYDVTDGGFTAAPLYSTASYQGVGFERHPIIGQ